MSPEKKKEGLLTRLEKLTIPSILILTFTIGGAIAVAKQTMASHETRIMAVETSAHDLNDKVSEMEKVPVKYDEQIGNLIKQQETTNQSIRDLRESVERTNELIIQALERDKNRR